MQPLASNETRARKRSASPPSNFSKQQDAKRPKITANNLNRSDSAPARVRNENKATFVDDDECKTGFFRPNWNPKKDFGFIYDNKDYDTKSLAYAKTQQPWGKLELNMHVRYKLRTYINPGEPDKYTAINIEKI